MSVRLRRGVARAARVALLLAAPSLAGAQAATPTEPPAEYPRPALPGHADGNDAEVWIEEAWRAVRKDRDRAVAAAYWATRVDPNSAKALLAYWQLRWMAEPRLLERVRRGDAKAIRSPEAMRIDSLHLKAMLRDPFAVVGDVPSYLVADAMAQARRDLAKDSSLVGAYIFLAKQHYEKRAFDSTVASLRGALRALERMSAERASPVYESRELFHFAIGRALYRAGDVNAARAEFARAASEALEFAPAHAELASIAWTNWSDLALARQEFDLALELREDAVVRYDYGTVLLDAKEPEAALVQFERAIALEPWFARAHFNRALALDRLGRRAEAVAAYRAFVERASRRLQATVDVANARISALEGEGTSP